MTTFLAISNGIGLTVNNKLGFKQSLKDNIGCEYRIEFEEQESKKQRRMFEGAVMPLWVYLDGNDYKSAKIIKQYREYAKLEFNPEIIMIGGKSVKVAGSTKGVLNKGFMERVVDFLEEQYGIDRTKVLNPKLWKKYRDEIRPFDTEYKYDTFIDYMRDLKLI